MKQDFQRNNYREYVENSRPTMWQCITIGMIAPVSMFGILWLAIAQATGGF